MNKTVQDLRMETQTKEILENLGDRTAVASITKEHKR